MRVLVGGAMAELVISARLGRPVGDSRLSDRWSGVDPADLAGSRQVGSVNLVGGELANFSNSGLVGSGRPVGDSRLTDRWSGVDPADLADSDSGQVGSVNLVGGEAVMHVIGSIA